MQEWFSKAKLGIFIHYGIYAVGSVAESWSFYNGRISYEDYMAQLDGFTACHFDAEAWADLIQRSGAQYAVLTAKHHDGVALYDTQYSDLSVVKRSPAKRDIVKEFNQAVQKRNLKTGTYFSLIDWSHPDYPSVYKGGEVPEHPEQSNPYSYPTDGKQDLAAWERFMAFNRNQLRELMTQYGTVDLLWFDGDWERDDQQWQLPAFKEYLQSLSPNVVINSRLGSYGDYETPEQGLPLIPPEGPWELCTTINTSWGYVESDHHYKTPQQIIRMFCDCLHMGGNLLLDIGPKEDGTIDPRQEQVLLELGEWISIHREAVYETQKGLPLMYYGEGSVLSEDQRTIYLFLHQAPQGHLPFKGLRSPVKRVTSLHDGKEIPFVMHGGVPWFQIPGILWLDVANMTPAKHTSVIKVELEHPLDLYDGKGIVVTDNQ